MDPTPRIAAALVAAGVLVLALFGVLAVELLLDGADLPAAVGSAR